MRFSGVPISSAVIANRCRTSCGPSRRDTSNAKKAVTASKESRLKAATSRTGSHGSSEWPSTRRAAFTVSVAGHTSDPRTGGDLREFTRQSQVPTLPLVHFANRRSQVHGPEDARKSVGTSL